MRVLPFTCCHDPESNLLELGIRVENRPLLARRRVRCHEHRRVIQSLAHPEPNSSIGCRGGVFDNPPRGFGAADDPVGVPRGSGVPVPNAKGYCRRTPLEGVEELLVWFRRNDDALWPAGRNLDHGNGTRRVLGYALGPIGRRNRGLGDGHERTSRSPGRAKAIRGVAVEIEVDYRRAGQGRTCAERHVDQPVFQRLVELCQILTPDAGRRRNPVGSGDHPRAIR